MLDALFGPFDAVDLAWILAAYAAAGFVKGVTGLGFATTCLPIMAFGISLKAGCRWCCRRHSPATFL